MAEYADIAEELIFDICACLRRLCPTANAEYEQQAKAARDSSLDIYRWITRDAGGHRESIQMNRAAYPTLAVALAAESARQALLRLAQMTNGDTSPTTISEFANWYGGIEMLFVATKMPLAEFGTRYKRGRKKGAYGQLRAYLQGIAETVGTTRFDEVLSHIRSVGDAAGDELGEGGNLAVEVEDDQERVWFPFDGNKPRSFKTIRNTLSKISLPSNPGKR